MRFGARIVKKARILFLCTGNSCRSQMAEAWTQRLIGDRFDACSAGIQPKGLDLRAVKVMTEEGMDISGQSSKDIESLGNVEFDYVITLCDNGKESCPFFPAKTRVMHQGFDDPPKFAEGVADEDHALSHYRRIRDEIREFVEKLPEALEEP
jgi:arsenate reductase